MSADINDRIALAIGGQALKLARVWAPGSRARRAERNYRPRESLWLGLRRKATAGRAPPSGRDTVPITTA